MTIGDKKVVGYVTVSALDALNICRNDEHNGCTEIWIRPTTKADIPLTEHSAYAELAAQVVDGKAQWDQVATLIGADKDDVDDVIRRAGELAAELESERAASANLHTNLIAACVQRNEAESRLAELRGSLTKLADRWVCTGMHSHECAKELRALAAADGG